MVTLQIVVSEQNQAKFIERYPHIEVKEYGLRLLALSGETAKALHESLRAVVRRVSANDWSYSVPHFEKNGYTYEFGVYGLNETEMGWIAQVGLVRDEQLVALYDVSLAEPEAEIIETVIDLLSRKGELSEIEVEDLITIFNNTMVTTTA